MKVLNLYSGIGGNRKLWLNVNVTAVELEKNIAEVYQDLYPNDNVIVGDAHEYLLNHYKEFDFIWTSPPCPTHSRARFWGSHRDDTQEVYPDMRLWQEIIFLKHFASALWVVENVQPYYEPLIQGKNIGRHYFWTNFWLPNYETKTEEFPKDSVIKLQELHGIDLTKYKNIPKQKCLRNCVLPEVGLRVFNCAVGAIPPIQEGLFADNAS